MYMYVYIYIKKQGKNIVFPKDLLNFQYTSLINAKNFIMHW